MKGGGGGGGGNVLQTLFENGLVRMTQYSLKYGIKVIIICCVGKKNTFKWRKKIDSSFRCSFMLISKADILSF